MATDNPANVATKEREQATPMPESDRDQAATDPFDSLLALASEIEARAKARDAVSPPQAAPAPRPATLPPPPPAALPADLSRPPKAAPAPLIADLPPPPQAGAPSPPAVLPPPPPAAPPPPVRSTTTTPAPRAVAQPSGNGAATLAHLPPPPATRRVLARPTWLPRTPIFRRETIGTMVWGAVAVVIAVLIVVLVARGDDIAQSLRGGSRHSSDTTDSVAELPTASSAAAPTSTADPALAAPASTEPPCSARAFWEANRPVGLEAMTITSARCVGDYALVSLTQPPTAAAADPAQLFITLRAIPDGWAVIATSTGLDCPALQQIDPGVPAQLCG